VQSSYLTVSHQHPAVSPENGTPLNRQRCEGDKEKNLLQEKNIETFLICVYLRRVVFAGG
jgi:hypothetical protein